MHMRCFLSVRCKVSTINGARCAEHPHSRSVSPATDILQSHVARARPRPIAENHDHAAGHRCHHGRMTTWGDVERAEPEFARRVRALFDAHRHKTIATLRADGAPRISGVEVV